MMSSSSSSSTQAGDSSPLPPLSSPTPDITPSSASTSSSTNTGTDQPRPKRQKLSYSDGEYITIVLQPYSVNDDDEPEWTKEILAPKNMICAHSNYFAHHCIPLNRESQSSKAGRIILKAHRPETLSIFLTYMYMGDLSSAESLPKVTTKVCEDADQRRTEYGMRFRALIECHILGHHIQAANFSNHIIDLLLTDIRSYYFETKLVLGFDPENIALVYCTQDYPLRGLLTEYALSMRNQDLCNLFLNYQWSLEIRAFQLDVQCRTRDRLDRERQNFNAGLGPLGNIYTLESCWWHIHTAGERCESLRGANGEVVQGQRDDGVYGNRNPRSCRR